MQPRPLAISSTGSAAGKRALRLGIFEGRRRLQLRKEVPTEHDGTASSFKVAVKLTPADALKIAGELLTAAGMMMRR
jgi:hypothetical protein